MRVYHHRHPLCWIQAAASLAQTAGAGQVLPRGRHIAPKREGGHDGRRPGRPLRPAGELVLRFFRRSSTTSPERP